MLSFDETGRAFPVQEYYLEDCIQMTNFVPPPNDRKRKRNNDDDDAGEAAMDVEGDDDGAAADLSKVCSNDYSVQVTKITNLSVTVLRTNGAF